MIEIIKLSLTAYMFSAIIQKDNSILSWYGNLIKRLPIWLYRPLGGCYICFTGQVCLWYFLVTKPFNLLEFGFFISAGIFLSVIYNAIYCWLK